MSKTRKMIADLNEQFEKKLALLEANQLLIDGVVSDCQSIEFTNFELTDTLDICFTGKAADLTCIWKALRKRGFKPDSNVEEGRKVSFHTFWRSEDTPLVIWLYFTSKECKIVQIGTKMVEQAVYEVQCDSELAELGV